MNIKIGNTPIIEVKYKFNNVEKSIYAKLEYYNPTGSIKDRVAYYIINNAIKRGELKKGMTIYEATSGNTGIALAALGTRLGFKVHIFMPDWASVERVKLMELYGAKVTLVSKEEGGFKKAIELAEKYSKENKGFLANQFKNHDNIIAHYETTGKEIINEVNNLEGFVSGIGTGGTLIGIGKRLKEFDNKIKVVALEPDKMPLLSGGILNGNHKIEGIGDDFIPELVDRKIIDDIYKINDDDAVNMARRLSHELGLGVGISSGANMIAAILLKEKVNGNVVTVFADDNKKYLSTELTNNISYDNLFISNKIVLI